MVATSKSVCSQAISQDSKQEASTEEVDPCGTCLCWKRLFLSQLVPSS